MTDLKNKRLSLKCPECGRWRRDSPRQPGGGGQIQANLSGVGCGPGSWQGIAAGDGGKTNGDNDSGGRHSCQ
jgi:hypothetical protein